MYISPLPFLLSCMFTKHPSSFGLEKPEKAHTYTHATWHLFSPPFVCLGQVAVLYSQQPPPSLVLVLCYLMSPHRSFLFLFFLLSRSSTLFLSFEYVQFAVRSSQFVVDALFSNRLMSLNLVNFQRANGGRRSEKKKKRGRKEGTQT